MRDRSGFTLVEVLIALVMLSFVLMGLVGTTGKLGHEVDTNERQALAISLAEDKLAEIQLDAAYDSLDARYEGTDTVLGFVRTVEDIVLVGGKGMTTDHKKITVRVDGNGLQYPVRRTVTVAAP